MTKMRAIAITILVLLQTCAASLMNNCHASSCGSIHNISYPFRLRGDPPGCGDKRYELECENNATVLALFSGKYNVEEIDYKRYKIRVSDAGVVSDANCSFTPRYFLGYSNFSNDFMGPGTDPLHLDEFQASIAYFHCADEINDDSRYIAVGPTSCSSLERVYAVVRGSRNNFSATDIKVGCQLKGASFSNWETVQDKKHNKNASYNEIHNIVSHGFVLSWIHVICEDRCGVGKFCRLVNESTGEIQCGHENCRYVYEANLSIYSCESTLQAGKLGIFVNVGIYCIHILKGLMQMFVFDKATEYDEIETEIGKNIGRYVIIKFLIGLVAFIILMINKWGRRHTSYYEDIEDFLQRNTLMPVRYSYKDIKHMTMGFKEKLGEGGFGLVYKGKLRSGSFVAIKILSKSKTNGQEFISEIASIGRIHHSNVVGLIGFCVEESNRALVYEFMSNGSLDNYIFSKKDNIPLTDGQIYEISLGVARGITYLHQGCDMQILHFDIKPHNILLDEHFIPKVSDFGLAKLYPIDKCIVTLTAARGTIGYMAPELFYHNIGGVSFKADVYSFRMLLMEMSSRRRNLNPRVENSSELFFPLWIYDQLNRENEIEMKDIPNEENNDVVKKMFLVALWCIQLKPSDRPSMNKVIDMLEGDLECIEMPPKPSLYPHEMIQDLKNDSEQLGSYDTNGSTSYLEESAMST